MSHGPATFVFINKVKNRYIVDTNTVQSSFTVDIMTIIKNRMDNFIQGA